MIFNRDFAFHFLFPFVLTDRVIRGGGSEQQGHQDC